MTQAAKRALKDQLKFRDLLIAHNIKGFKRFLKRNKTQLSEDVLDYSDEKLGELMHYLKTKYPYLGESFQHSRNYFRVKILEGEIVKGLVNGALLNYLKEHDNEPPRCNDCQFFRTAPTENELPCIHLIEKGSTPALPMDYACAGWTPMVTK